MNMSKFYALAGHLPLKISSQNNQTSRKNALNLKPGLGSRSRSEPGVLGSLEPELLEKKQGAVAVAARKKKP